MSYIWNEGNIALGIGLISLIVIIGLFILYAVLVSAENADQGKGLHRDGDGAVLGAQRVHRSQQDGRR